jgi:hypothetical protein
LPAADVEPEPERTAAPLTVLDAAAAIAPAHSVETAAAEGENVTASPVCLPAVAFSAS